MKSILHQLASVAAVALFAVAVSAPEAQAADVKLDGYGYYKLGSTDVYSRLGKPQSGRYRSLGSDYYHKVEYGIDFISNLSGSRSGLLSYEFWAMPYYGATSGIVLMTRGVDRLSGGGAFEDVVKAGYAVSLDVRRFPEQNLWELTRNGWKFRDSLTFSRKANL